jgi:hypothetical protein
MSLRTKINEKKSEAMLRENAKRKLYSNSRKYRAAQMLEAWKTVPEIGDGLEKLDEAARTNVVINLTNQARHMNKMTEAQMSNTFSSFTPENMLRLVRLAMPNVIRSKVFTEFAMETSRDTIKYITPVYSSPSKKNAKGGNMKGTHHGFDNSDDPYNMVDTDESFDINSDEYRRALYERTDGERFSNDLWNFKAATVGKWTVQAGENGDLPYIDGYTTVVARVLHDGKTEDITVAMQDKRTKKFFVDGKLKSDDDTPLKFVVNGTEAFFSKNGSDAVDTLKYVFGPSDEVELMTSGTTDDMVVYGLFDSEGDWEGDYLGEVDIRMRDYEFKPRRTAIGVSWSQLSEITLDTSFNVSAEEFLITYASQEIRVALDNRALKLAYGIAMTNPEHYRATFDAAYNSGDGTDAAAKGKDGYVDNAQTLPNAISALGDAIYNDINRSGISRLVAGPAAATYCQLVASYTAKGRQTAVGAHQFGELDGMPLFKVPSTIIPNDKILCV